MKALIFLIFALIFSIQTLASSYSVNRVSANHTVASSEELTLLTSNTLYTLTLPSCASGNDGEWHKFRNINGGGQCDNICPASGEKLEGTVNACWMICNYEAEEFSCDGTNGDWHGLNYWN